ncbi:MAG: ABC transporter substrate-binding protein [Kofleriaceae bacterium]|nr:ABC transporter substrate-binding protein [Kofleriaceae bacterium]
MTRALGIIALLAVIGCDPPSRTPRWRGAGSSTPHAGGTLHLAVKDRVKTLDPSIAYDEVSFIAVHALHDTLVDYAPDSNELAPRLAERWEVAPDARTLRFWLRAGIAYADGTPILARDFARGLDRARTSPDSPFGSLLGDLESVHAPSDRELVVHLARPNVAFLYVLAMPFACPQRAGEAPASGPYMVAQWAPGERLVLVKNPHYWDPARGRIEHIELREQVPRDTQFMMFERGELDAIERLSHPDLLWVTAQPAWAPFVRTQSALNVYGARMNVRVKPFDDVRVRQALNYALNKAHTVKLLAGTAVPAHGMLPPGTLGRARELAPYPHDAAKARALLAEAGYPDGLDLDFMTIADEEAEKLAAAMHGDFAEVGVRVRVQLVSFATWVSMVGKPDGPAFSYGTWIADTADPSSFFDARFHSRAITDEYSTNDSFYANPEVDALLDSARAEADPTKRAELYAHVERILYADAPWIWNYHQQMVEVLQPYVRDYAPHPVWGRDFTRAWLDLDAGGERVPW